MSVEVKAHELVGPAGRLALKPDDEIARKFAIKRDAIEAENPGLDPTKLKVGQKIRVPKK